MWVCNIFEEFKIFGNLKNAVKSSQMRWKHFYRSSKSQLDRKNYGFFLGRCNLEEYERLSISKVVQNVFNCDGHVSIYVGGISLTKTSIFFWKIPSWEKSILFKVSKWVKIFAYMVQHLSLEVWGLNLTRVRPFNGSFEMVRFLRTFRSFQTSKLSHNILSCDETHFGWR